MKLIANLAHHVVEYAFSGFICIICSITLYFEMIIPLGILPSLGVGLGRHINNHLTTLTLRRRSASSLKIAACLMQKYLIAESEHGVDGSIDKIL